MHAEAELPMLDLVAMKNAFALACIQRLS